MKLQKFVVSPPTLWHSRQLGQPAGDCRRARKFVTGGLENTEARGVCPWRGGWLVAGDVWSCLMILVLCQKKWCKFGLVSNRLCMLRKMTCGHLFFVGSGWQSFVLWWVVLPGIFVLLLRAWSQDLPGLCLLGGRRKNAGVFGVSRKWLADEDGFIARGRDCWCLLYGFMLQETLKFQASTLLTGSWNPTPQTLVRCFHEGRHEFLIEQNFLIFGVLLGDLFQASDWWHHWLVKPKATWWFR